MRRLLHSLISLVMLHVGSAIIGAAHVMRLFSLRKKGFAPACIVDVGANHGDWTAKASRVWPNASFFLVEPNPNLAGALQRTGRSFATALVGDRNANVTMWMAKPKAGRAHKGSSVFVEAGSPSNFVPTPMPMVRLDDLLHRHHRSNSIPTACKAVQMVKVDAQGAELLQLPPLRDGDAPFALRC